MKNPETVPLEIEIANDRGRHPSRLQLILGKRGVLAHERHVPTSKREVIRGDELVRTVSDDDDAAQLTAPSMVSAALRPDAPMTPPPGCVPEPH